MKITFTIAVCLFVLVLLDGCRKTQRQYNTPEIKVNQQRVRIDEPVCTVSRNRIINGNIYTSVDQQPEFPGGWNNFDKFVKKHLKYPKEANGARGRIIVAFVVNQNGSLSDMEVVGSKKHPALKKEALRIMKTSPKWNPGKINRQDVRVQYTVPILFDKVK